MANSPPPPPLSVRSYIIYMTAITLGLKIADNTRRIVQSSRPQQRHKEFFALVRGIFPVQELCGAMTALSLARREVLSIGEWDVVSLGPAVALHAAAALRGVKAFFASTKSPWDELQIQAWSTPSESGPQQLAVAGSLNLLWILALVRIVLHLSRSFASLARQQSTTKTQEIF